MESKGESIPDPKAPSEARSSERGIVLQIMRSPLAIKGVDGRIYEEHEYSVELPEHPSSRMQPRQYPR